MSIILTLLILCIIVILHEWGHFIVAKKSGVLVEEFAVGMGPKLFSVKRGETMYSLRLIPIGGYCKMADEVEEGSQKLGFNQVSLPKRIAISFAGPFMNFVLAFLVFVFITMCTGYSTVNVTSVIENTPAYNAGIKPGDKIVNYAGHNIHTRDEMEYCKEKYADDYVSVVVKRNGEKINTELAAQKTEKGYSLGLQLDYKAPLINVMDYNGENITKGSVLSYFSQGYWGLVSMVKIMVLSFADLFTGSVAVSELSGPIGVTTAVGSVYQEAARVSIWAVVLSMLNMVALLSVNLGIINLFPLPALDGGRIIIYIVELFVGRELPKSVEAMIHAIGFVLIMGLGVIIAFNDILKLV